MVLRQDVHELLGKVLGDFGVAVGYVGNEIDQLAQRYDARIVGRRGRRHENFPVTFILIVLSAEVLNVRPKCNTTVLENKNPVIKRKKREVRRHRKTHLGSLRILCCKLGL